MRYTALINKDGLCINAMATLSDARLEPVAGAVEIAISKAEFDARPIGWRWDGKVLRAPARPLLPPTS